LHQEQTGLIELMQNTETVRRGMRDYVTGSLLNIDCVCVLSRIGKVAAAITAATLIERFNVTHIIFTGVAGAADATVAVGDIVVAEGLIQHDMDATPLFPRFEIPLTGLSTFLSDKRLSDYLEEASDNFISYDFEKNVDAADRATFRLLTPCIHRGLIISGDEFLDSHARLLEIKKLLPNALAIEMEGAAVAQVCFEFGIPFAVIRTISDGANEKSAHDFIQFIERVASRYAFGIVKRFCALMGKK